MNGSHNNNFKRGTYGILRFVSESDDGAICFIVGFKDFATILSNRRRQWYLRPQAIFCIAIGVQSNFYYNASFILPAPMCE